jgi:hypothetical protein
MTTKSRQSLYGASIRASAERAREARKEADKLARREPKSQTWLGCEEADAATASMDTIRTILARATDARHAPFRREHF